MQTQTIVLASRPSGTPTAAQFRFETSELRPLEDGQVLLKTLYVSLDPAMRVLMNEGKSFAEPYALDQPLVGALVAEVAESRLAHLPVGTAVVGSLPWQEFVVSDGQGLQVIASGRVPLSYYLSLLGLPGIAAYFGLLELGNAQAGETLVVSGAAGAVGLVTGQLAKLRGYRVVGTAGSDEKVAYLKSLGFDEAINYKTADLGAALAAAAPRGVDCYVDNVGGPLTDAVYEQLNKHARILVFGQIAHYNATEVPTGPRPEGRLQLLAAKIQGFQVYDYAPRWPEAVHQLTEWHQQGQLRFKETITEGFDQLPAAFLGLFKGENTGKSLVKVAEPSAR